MVSLAYSEILLSILCLFIAIAWCFFTNINGLPWNWPLVGMLPSLLCHVHRVHDRCLEIFDMAGGTFHLKGPRFCNMDIVLTADPANVHFIMSSNFINFPKGVEFRKIFDVLGDGIFNSDSESWINQRKQARFLINHDRFRKFLIKTTLEKIEHGLVPVLEHSSGRGLVVDLQDLFQRFTFDTTCILVTGFDPGCLSIGLPDVPFSRAMDDVEEAIFMRHCLPETFWKLERFLGIGHEKQLAQAWKVLDNVIHAYISKKRDELSHKVKVEDVDVDDELSHKVKVEDVDVDDEAGFDLLTSYITEGEGGGGVNDDKFLRDTILNFMIAGRDTTSSALTWFTWLVATHPDVEKKIRDELDGIAGATTSASAAIGHQKWRLFAAEEVRDLVYLHGALCETLRLYPPVPFQHKAPVEAVVLPSGQRVEPEMRVVFPMYAMGRMESVWGEDAKEFKPERWISERRRVRYEPSYKFLAFNAGPRSCLGKEVAFTQLKCVAAAMIHNYQVEVVKGHIATPNVSVILYMKHGLKVRVSKRWT